MNLLLLEPHEVTSTGRSVLDGRRAKHMQTVLRAEVGQRLRAGLLDGPLGTALIERIGDGEVVVQTTFDQPSPPADDTLLLAVPRPRVLLRMLGHAAALGFGRIVLLRTWRVEKTQLLSSAMNPAVQREHLLLGLEQAGRTRLPRIEVFPAFKPFVEDALDGLGLPEARFVAHPEAAVATAEIQLPAAPFTLALGPDGGFIPFEVEQLAERGFLPVHCGRHPLRTETALAVLAGQLDLLRQQARGNEKGREHDSSWCTLW